jgi:hypothetical protein
MTKSLAYLTLVIHLTMGAFLPFLMFAVTSQADGLESRVELTINCNEPCDPCVPFGVAHSTFECRHRSSGSTGNCRTEAEDAP